MFSWFAIYLILAIFVIAFVIWIWRGISGWWYPTTTPAPIPSEIFFHKENLHHKLRLYLIETAAELESAQVTLSMIKENFYKMSSVWEEILEKEHYLSLVELERKRLNIHLGIADELLFSEDEECASGKRRNLRKLNREISELHEDWWGLKFDSSRFMKLSNEMDACYVDQVINIRDEEYESSKEDFQSILFIQNEIKECI